MFKKLIVLIVMFSCVTAQGVIVNRYSFNDGDTTAIDSVSGKDGTLEGTATISGNRLVLDGSGAAVWLPSDTLDPALTAVTVECWIEVSSPATWARGWEFGASDGSNGGYSFYFVPNSGSNNTQFSTTTTGFPGWQTGEESITSDGLEAGVYTHVACVFDSAGAEMKMYIDGELAASAPTTMDLSLVAREKALIGDSTYSGDPGLNGSVDEFRIYDTAMSDGEVLDSFNAGPDAEIGKITKASRPDPSNGKTEVPREVVLGWRPGDYAETHNVYFGTDAALVEAGDASVLVGDGQTDAFLDVGVLPYDGVFFWRVDEVNAAPDLTVYPGDVWSFAIEASGYPIPASSIEVFASSEIDADQGALNTINESGLTDGMHSVDGTDSWLSDSSDPGTAWIQYDFDKAYKLVQMKVWNYNGPSITSGLGIKDVNIVYSLDGTTWSVLDAVTEFAQASGTEDYEGETINIDIAAKSIKITANSAHGGAMFDQYGLSEIKFLRSPVRATMPVPESGTALEDTEVTLGWKPGRGADEHHVYMSTDEQEITDLTAAAVVVTDPEIDAILSLANTYYWTVVEVNNNNTPAGWAADTWNLSTPDYFVISDFEENMDGWYSDGGGSVELSTDASRDSQSLKFSFNNDIPDGYSEAKLVYGDPNPGWWWDGGTANLTKGDPTDLVFWIYGDLDNVLTEQLYVKFTWISGWDFKWWLNTCDPIYSYALYKNVVDVSEIGTPWWTQITIPMDYYAVPFHKVKSISIGVMRSALTSGSGDIIIDDVRLYGDSAVPVPPPVPVNPGDANLVAEYLMENNVDDSSGSGINGIALGEPNFVAGPFGNYGNALECDGSDDLVDLGPADPFNFTGSFSFSVWANIQDWSSEWGHAMVAARGEGTEGFQIRRGGGWVGGMQGQPSTGYCFTTRGIGLSEYGAGNEDMMVGEPVQGAWTHIACVYDQENNVKSIYFDGELIQASPTVPDSVLSPASQNASIGARANGGNTGFEALFNGMLDEVKIYDDALTAGEVRFLADPTP
jgi:hypothetical protein